jgi:hypothetical protein
MTALYVIAQTFRADADKLADLDLDPQTLIDTIEGMSGDLETKVQNILFVSRNLESTADAIDAAAAAMIARSKAIKARAIALKKGVFDAMLFTGVTNIEGPYFRLTIQNNPPSVDVFEADTVPAEYWTQPATPPKVLDKTAIKNAIKGGAEVPGAKLSQSQRLVIA